MKKSLEMLGWSGMVLLLVAFAANSLGYLGARSFPYQMMNLLGAAGIALHASKRRAYPAAVLNVIWGAIALIAILQLLSR